MKSRRRRRSPAPATPYCDGADGTLFGDMFDGEGFVRGVKRNGRELAGKKALVVGSGGVGSAIAASLAAAGVARLGLFDVSKAAAKRSPAGCARIIRSSRSQLGSKDPQGYDIVDQRDADRHEARAIRCRSMSSASRPRPSSARW